MLFSFGDIIAFVRYAAALRLLAKRLNPDVIHANVPKSHVAVFLVALFGFRGRCCFHIREIFNKNSIPFLAYAALFPKSKSVVISISHAVENSLPPSMRRKSTVIYNGVAVGGKLQSPVVRNPQLRLLYLGRIVPWKGCHILVDILSALRLRIFGQAVSLSLVGDSTYWSQDYRATLSTKIKNEGMNDSCSLLPHTSDVRDALLSHDLFVNASRLEPFGRSMAEAQAAGLPVVSFDSGGVKEVVSHGETGFLVPYGDVNAFVDAVGRFAQDRALIRTMGDKGYERAKKYFNREIQIPAMWDFLRDFSAGRNREGHAGLPDSTDR